MKNERTQQVLRALIMRYLREGQPVGSKTLVKDLDIKISSATIRNIMSELESLGFVRSKHTSSGRVPTPVGLRLFIDNMLRYQNPDEQEVAYIESSLQSHLEPQQIIKQASKTLANMTQCAGVVSFPKHAEWVLQHIEFLRLATNQILVVLVVNERVVHNAIIELNDDISDEELRHMGRQLTEWYSGHTFEEMKRDMLNKLHQEQVLMDDSLSNLLSQASKMIHSAELKQEDYMVAGKTQLMKELNYENLLQLKELYAGIGEKQKMLSLIEQCLNADGARIFIGSESGYEVLGDYAMVTQTYGGHDKQLGVLGVIGPVWMDYPKIVPLVDVTARVLSGALHGTREGSDDNVDIME